jgi:hypothetical protein
VCVARVLFCKGTVVRQSLCCEGQELGLGINDFNAKYNEVLQMNFLLRYCLWSVRS